MSTELHEPLALGGHRTTARTLLHTTTRRQHDLLERTEVLRRSLEPTPAQVAQFSAGAHTHTPGQRDRVVPNAAHLGLAAATPAVGASAAHDLSRARRCARAAQTRPRRVTRGASTPDWPAVQTESHPQARTLGGRQALSNAVSTGQTGRSRSRSIHCGNETPARTVNSTSTDMPTSRNSLSEISRFPRKRTPGSSSSSTIATTYGTSASNPRVAARRTVVQLWMLPIPATGTQSISADRQAGHSARGGHHFLLQERHCGIASCDSAQWCQYGPKSRSSTSGTGFGCPLTRRRSAGGLSRHRRGCPIRSRRSISPRQSGELRTRPEAVVPPRLCGLRRAYDPRITGRRGC